MTVRSDVDQPYLAAPASRFARVWQSRPELSPIKLNLLSATFIMAVYNKTFWGRAYEVFDGRWLTIAVFGLAIWSLTLLIISLFGFRWLQKPVLAFLLVMSAVTSFYMDTLGVVIDREMIQNAMTTTFTESKHLITFGFISHVLLFGLLPALVVSWAKLRPQGLWRNLWTSVLISTLSVALFFGLLLSDFKTYSAALRERKEMAWSYQPGAPIAGAYRYARLVMRSQNIVVAPLGLDAKKGPLLSAAKKPVLTVIVAGETARAQNFSLNGYARNTNPELARRDIAYFSNVSSCGTATATSLPCMFSNLTRDGYSYEKGVSTENLLDVLGHAGVKVEWFDNNTGDKHIAARATYQSVLAEKDPLYCGGGECIDGIFWAHLQNVIDTMTEDTVIVLHQIGSHGPAYYLRYAKERELFTPACQTAEFAKCSVQEIVNAYDNSIAYTDYFLARTIDMLAAQDKVIPSMLYISDHGESLGEDGLFLHGAPYFMAPENQTRVPMLMWLSDAYKTTFGYDAACLQAKADLPLSHDNLFPSVLGMMDIQTKARYDGLNLMADCIGAPS